MFMRGVLKTKLQSFIFSSVELPKHFVLIPKKSITLFRGQDSRVTCECDGAADATLKWEKKGNKGSYSVVPESKVTIIKDLITNRVQAILKIVNAKLTDSGSYKCIVMVEPDKSDYRLTTVRVIGRFVRVFTH